MFAVLGSTYKGFTAFQALCNRVGDSCITRRPIRKGASTGLGRHSEKKGLGDVVNLKNERI